MIEAYCKECKYFQLGVCEHPNNIIFVETYLTRNKKTYRQLPEQKNEYNTCNDFKACGKLSKIINTLL